MSRNHFFKSLFRFVRISGGGEFVCMMHCVDDKLFFHSHCEDSVSILEFFIPFIIGIGVGKVEVISGTLTAPKYD